VNSLSPYFLYSGSPSGVREREKKREERESIRGDEKIVDQPALALESRRPGSPCFPSFFLYLCYRTENGREGEKTSGTEEEEQSAEAGRHRPPGLHIAVDLDPPWPRRTERGGGGEGGRESLESGPFQPLRRWLLTDYPGRGGQRREKKGRRKIEQLGCRSCVTNHDLRRGCMRPRVVREREEEGEPGIARTGRTRLFEESRQCALARPLATEGKKGRKKERASGRRRPMTLARYRPRLTSISYTFS